MTLADDPKTHTPISMRWSSAEHLDDLRASINISRVRTFEQFRSTLRELVGVYCAGSVQSLLMNLIRSEKLSASQLVELKRLAEREPLKLPRRRRRRLR